MSLYPQFKYMTFIYSQPMQSTFINLWPLNMTGLLSSFLNITLARTSTVLKGSAEKAFIVIKGKETSRFYAKSVSVGATFAIFVILNSLQLLLEKRELGSLFKPEILMGDFCCCACCRLVCCFGS